MFRAIILFFIGLACADAFAYLHRARFVSPRNCLVNESNCTSREFYEFAKIYNLNSAQVAEQKYTSLIKNSSTLEAKVWGYVGLRVLNKITDAQARKELQLLSGRVKYLRLKVFEVSPWQAYQWLTSDYRLGSPLLTIDNYPAIPDEYFEVDLNDFYIDISPESQRKYAKQILKNASMILSDGVSASGEYPCEVWAFVYLLRYSDAKTRIADIDEISQYAISNAGRVYCYELFNRLGENKKALSLKKKYGLEKELYITMKGCICGEESFENALKIINDKRYIPLTKTSLIYNRHSDRSREKYDIADSIKKKPTKITVPISERNLKLPNHIDINQDGELSLFELFFIAYISSEKQNDIALVLNEHEKYLKFYKGESATFFTNHNGSWQVVKVGEAYRFKLADFSEFGTHVSFYIEKIWKSVSKDFYLSAMGYAFEIKKKRTVRKFSAKFLAYLTSRVFDDSVKKLKPVEWRVYFSEFEGVIASPIFSGDFDDDNFLKSVSDSKKNYEKLPLLERKKFVKFCEQNSLKAMWD